VTLVLVVLLEVLFILTHPCGLLVIHTGTLNASNFILKSIAKVNSLNSQDACGTVAHIIAMNKTWKMFVIQKSTVRHAKLLSVAALYFLISEIFSRFASDEMREHYFHRICILFFHALISIDWWPFATLTLFVMHAKYNNAKIYTPWFCRKLSSGYYMILCIIIFTFTIIRMDMMQKDLIANSILTLNLLYSLKGLKDAGAISLILGEFIFVKRGMYGYLLQYYRRELLFDIVEDMNTVQIIEEMSGIVHHESSEVVKGVAQDFGLQEFSFLNIGQILCELVKAVAQDLQSFDNTFENAEKIP